MNKRIYILSLLAFLLTGCFSAKVEKGSTAGSFAKENTALIKEMTEYAILFCLENKITSFRSEIIADKKIRKKMERLGASITVTYQSRSDQFDDSTVTFQSSGFSYDSEYRYDFAANPKNKTNETKDREDGVLVKVNERIYYKYYKKARRPFPMM